MTGSTKFELRKPVTPYICSTPVDFTQEREFLSDVIFPKLFELCRSRGAYFCPVDLHWKPGDAKTQEGLLLKTSLDSIKRCSPFFICLLGETYGPFRDENSPLIVLSKKERNIDIPEDCHWLDKNLILAESGSHSWVLEEGQQFSSLTELEVTQGALMCDSPYVTLYFRRSDHLNSKLQLQSENMDKKDDDMSIYYSESDQAKFKIDNLKQKLVNKGVLVKYFSTLDELGELVLEDWLGIIDICLPPLLHDVKLFDTIEYREWLAQQSFIDSRSEIFISTQDVEETLQKMTEFAMTCTKADNKGEGHDNFAAVWSDESHSYRPGAKFKKKTHNNTSSSIILLSGGRGVGKSSLAAHWLNEFRADNPHICVISHFVSASDRSSELEYFLSQCTRTLRRQFLLSESFNANSHIADIENPFEQNGENFLALCEAFVAAVGLGPCVILLDGLNELNCDRTFDWLPESLPATCKLIFTTLISDISYSYLSQRCDTIDVTFPTSLTDANATFAMIRQHLPTLSQLIGGEKAMKQLDQLKIMHTALGSRVIGSELTCYRVYSNMDFFMERCTEVWSLRNFWTMCLQNWVQTHSWTVTHLTTAHQFVDGGFDYSGWVMDCLCLVAMSRNGLTQNQILSLLKMIGYEADLEVTSYDWLQFRLSAGVTLQELGDGRLVFGHKYLQEIMEHLFFKSITSSSYDLVTILRSAKNSRRQMYHEYLARYFSQQKLDVQVLEELPWHLLFSGNITDLVNCLTNCQAVLKMLSDNDLWQQDLKLYWSVCQMSGHLPDILCLQLMHSLGVVDINDIQELEEKYSHSGVTSPKDRIAASTPEPSESCYDEEVEQKPGLTADLGFVGKTTEFVEKQISKDIEVSYTGISIFVTQAVSGSKWQLHNFSLSQKMDNSSDVASLGWYLARFLQTINYVEASTILFSSLVNYIKQNCSLTTEQYILLSRCHHSLGDLHEKAGDLDAAETEFRLALHAIMAAIDLDDENTYQETTLYLKGLLLNCHGSIRISKKQLFDSEELLKEALDCVKDNSDCIVLKSAIYFNLGIIRSYQTDYSQAQFYLSETAKLRNQWFGRCHPLLADVLLALARLLVTQNSMKGNQRIQAKSIYRQALHIQEKYLGASHSSVADILFELGTLLAEETDRFAKLEAQEYLRQSLDIRTTNLGGDHPVTVATQQTLTKLDVALLMKNYEFGSIKHADSRSHKTPFSALTMREPDLSRLLSREKSKSAACLKDLKTISSRNQTGIMNHNRPDSITNTLISLTSASERLLSAPISEMPRLLWRKRENESSNCLEHGLSKTYSKHDKKEIREALVRVAEERDRGILVKNDMPQTESQSPKDGTGQRSVSTDPDFVGGQQSHPITADIQQRDEEDSNVLKEDYVETLDSYANFTGLQNANSGHAVLQNPSSNIPKLFKKFEKGKAVDRPLSWTTMSRNSRSSRHRACSGRSNLTAVSSSFGSHLSSCTIPGRHDITPGNTQTISGPHSCLTSLLGDPPCPRQISSRLHHVSAWYHVQGRYSTPQQPYPKKRMQRTRNAREIEAYLALKSRQAETNQNEFQQLQGHDLTQPTDHSDSNSHIAPGTHMFHLGSPVINLYGYPRRIHKPNSRSSLVISGLEISRKGYPEGVSTNQSHFVKFKKQVTVE